jgi:NADH dehydrogenase
VDEYLRLPDRPGVHAIGDLAAFVQDGEELPMLAPPAMQQARHLAKNLLREIAGKAPLPFRYRDKGIMATIGRKAAVAETGSMALRGVPGWVAWLVLHLWYIIGFRNRFLILLQWAWEYFRYDRPIRLIVKAKERSES